MREQARLVPGHAPAAEPLGVTGPHIEDEGEVRPQDGRKIVHVALVADARLHDPEILVAVRIQHGAGHPYLVVVVERRPGRLAVFGKDGSQRLLEGGLARRARDAHHFCARLVAPVRGEPPQRPDGIRNHEHGRAQRHHFR